MKTKRQNKGERGSSLGSWIGIMSKRMLFILLVMTPILAFSQDEVFGEDNDPNDEERQFIKRTTLEAGITLAANSDIYLPSITGVQYWGFGNKNRRFKVGLGLRFSAIFGNGKLDYITAPADITSDEANKDTVLFTGTQVNSLNAYIALRYDFTERWGIETNIDLAGFSFGAEKNGILTYDNGKLFTTNGTPTAGNLLLIGNSDIGSLASEFLLTYRYKSNWKFKAGASFQFTEYSLGRVVKYTADNGTILETQRYRSKDWAVAIGVNYAF